MISSFENAAIRIKIWWNQSVNLKIAFEGIAKQKFRQNSINSIKS